MRRGSTHDRFSGELHGKVQQMHVFRPLFVIAAFVAIILIARVFFIPDDFGVHESGYMYGWYRLSNVDEWKNVAVKYRGGERFYEKNDLVLNSFGDRHFGGLRDYHDVFRQNSLGSNTGRNPL